MYRHAGTPAIFTNDNAAQPRFEASQIAPIVPALVEDTRGEAGLDFLETQVKHDLLESTEGITIYRGAKLLVKLGYQAAPGRIQYVMLDEVILRRPVEVDASVSMGKRHRKIVGFSISSAEYRDAHGQFPIEEQLEIRAKLAEDFMGDKMDLLRKKGLTIRPSSFRDIQLFRAE
jgi:hypothetical protein